MNESVAAMLRVRNWGELYENNRSREIDRTAWFPAPNDLSSDGYAELVAHDDGAAHFGVWNALLMVASRAKPEVVWFGKMVGHTPQNHSRASRDLQNR
jgi:hypothetical protein